MSTRKFKKLSVAIITVLMLTVVSVFVASAVYSDGTVTLGNGWWNGRFTTTGYNSVPTNGTLTTRSVSTAVSLTGQRKEVIENIIWGRATITQYGELRLNDVRIVKHIYEGNKVDKAYWGTTSVPIYGQ